MDSGLPAASTERSGSTLQDITGERLENRLPDAVRRVAVATSVAHVMRVVCVKGEYFMDEPFILYQKWIWWVVDGAIVSPTPISVVMAL